MPPPQAVTVEDFEPRARSTFTGRTLLLLAVVQVSVVAVFAWAYYIFITQQPPMSTTTATPFVAASIVWFAFCGLLSGILGKMLLGVLAEIRLTNSRMYLATVLRAYTKLGVGQHTVLKLVELALYKQTSDETIDARSLAPILQLVKALNKASGATSKKE